ncbi:GGDEF domain-containing protein [Sphingomonas sp. PAMC 26617]|uniref:GGDEF domain-containing protein n=1 Tax=Sphingomonas sp. PAMC 26617 TaxID=1112216 RepID=UPI0002897ED0|nr:GGDEF domain-containing protein [Sphingomonas sp. PAMC 26617]
MATLSFEIETYSPVCTEYAGQASDKRLPRPTDGAAVEGDLRWLDHFERAERLSEIGSWRLDLASTAMAWTRQARCLFDLGPEDPNPTWDRFLEFYPNGDRMVLMQAIDRAIDTGQSFEVETEIVTRTGRRRRLRNVGEIERGGGRGDCSILIGICQDITVQHEFERALERSALVDELTGIANRAALNQFLTERVDRRTNQGVLAVVLIDLDNFKSVNDTYGHQSGDHVLQRAARTLARHADGRGLAARLGGDEFVLAITASDTITSLRTALADLLADLTIAVEGADGTIAVRATMGACLLDQGITTRDEILRRADLSLYNAKALGKGRAMVAGDLRPILPAADGRGS